MIKILAAGKLKEKFSQEWAKEYLKRLKKYDRVEILEFKESNSKKEAEQFLRLIKNKDCVVALERVGESMKSEDFVPFIQQTLRNKNLCFLIGGPEGLAPEILTKADLHLSLSAMTFTHQMTRVILLEQIYRAFTILNKEPYHRY
ncbi:23S rRNA (pseudouridine(1915)-N(3))-methyltransferase RlmH [Candidatus Woesearchaeota archaeon]|nr:23S rRNA (pseudouridine(1915)-N(3))-methyltransferase RlmH [Candidatus Woesearchaeota archaeon]